MTEHAVSDEINIRFTYHPPKENQPKKYQEIRDQALLMADWIEKMCPESRERSLAIMKLEEVVFWANASIARRE